jgi:hypothetical protein
MTRRLIGMTGGSARETERRDGRRRNRGHPRRNYSLVMKVV